MVDNVVVVVVVMIMLPADHVSQKKATETALPQGRGRTQKRTDAARTRAQQPTQRGRTTSKELEHARKPQPRPRPQPQPSPERVGQAITAVVGVMTYRRHTGTTPDLGQTKHADSILGHSVGRGGWLLHRSPASRKAPVYCYRAQRAPVGPTSTQPPKK